MKKEFDIKKYCEKLIGKRVKYHYDFPNPYDTDADFHGKIIRVRLEILEEETNAMTLRSPKLVEYDNGEVSLFE